ncbi:MAG: hypothetical protein ACRCZQ_06250 [Bacteroidales bacterium]
MASKTKGLEKWIEAQKRHRLSDKHVQMARELGFNPDKLGKIDNHKQESWKAPLPQYIEELYSNKFNREAPAGVIKSVRQILAEIKAEHKSKKKNQNPG